MPAVWGGPLCTGSVWVHTAAGHPLAADRMSPVAACSFLKSSACLCGLSLTAQISDVLLLLQAFSFVSDAFWLFVSWGAQRAPHPCLLQENHTHAYPHTHTERGRERDTDTHTKNNKTILLNGLVGGLHHGNSPQICQRRLSSPHNVCAWPQGIRGDVSQDDQGWAGQWESETQEKATDQEKSKKQNKTEFWSKMSYHIQLIIYHFCGKIIIIIPVHLLNE